MEEENSKPKWGRGLPVPDEYKIKPGETLNPAGRPKGTKNRATILKQWLEMPAKVRNPITKEEGKGTLEDLVILALIGKALKGDVPAIREVLDGAYGKMVSRVDQTTNGESMNKTFSDFLKQAATVQRRDGLDVPIQDVIPIDDVQPENEEPDET